ncbi:hypothetical protein D3C76_1227510 [compost metagenome]
MCSAVGVNVGDQASLSTTSSSNHAAPAGNVSDSRPQSVTNMNFSRNVKYSSNN